MQILKAARDVFKTFGYKKTSMNDIAKVCGKGKSSIYYYFESKEDIFKAVILYEATIYRGKVLKAIKEADDPYKKLKSYILIRLQTDKILSNFHSALKDTNLRHIKFVDKLKTLYDKEEFRIFSNILQSGVSSNYFEIYDIKYAAIGIVNAMRGIEATLLLNTDDPLLENKVNNILNVVLFGIIKR